MAHVIGFSPRDDSMEKKNDMNHDFAKAIRNVEERFGISFLEYMGLEGEKEEVNKQVARAMQKEFFKLNTKYNEY